MTLLKKRARLCIFRAYWCLLTGELLLSNPWVIFGERIALAPPLDTSANFPSFALHFGAYGILYLLYKITNLSVENPEREWLYGCYFVGHAVGMELMQYWVPNRWPSLIDIVANFVGLGVSYFCLRWIKLQIAYRDRLGVFQKVH